MKFRHLAKFSADSLARLMILAGLSVIRVMVSPLSHGKLDLSVAGILGPGWQRTSVCHRTVAPDPPIESFVLVGNRPLMLVVEALLTAGMVPRLLPSICDQGRCRSGPCPTIQRRHVWDAAAESALRSSGSLVIAERRAIPTGIPIADSVTSPTVVIDAESLIALSLPQGRLDP